MSAPSQDDEAWRYYAACRGVGHRAFFPRAGQTADKAILRYCEQCPVTKECFNYKVQTGSVGGVWGGVYDRRDSVIERDLEAVAVVLNLPTRTEIPDDSQDTECQFPPNVSGLPGSLHGGSDREGESAVG